MRLTRQDISAARNGIHLGFWTVCDQAIVAGSNFFIMVLLARTLGARGFGTFSLAMTAIVFANTLQSAVFTQPHSVYGAAKSGSDYKCYTSMTGALQLAFSASLAGITALAAAVCFIVNNHYGALLLALALALFAWQAQEFCRRVLYTERRVADAVRNDLISYGAQLPCIALMAHLHALTEVTALLAIAATSMVAAIYGLRQNRHSLSWGRSWAGLRNAYETNWSFGRWLLGSTLLSWASTYVYPIAVASLVDVGATGAMRAIQNLLGPVNILFRAVDLVTVPVGSAEFQNAGLDGLLKYMRKITLLAAPVIVAYCALLTLFAGPIVRVLYGAAYEQYAWLLMLFAIASLLTYCNLLAEITLRCARSSSTIFRAYVGALVIALPVGLLAVIAFGLKGAAYGLLIHLAILNVLEWRAIVQLKGAPPDRVPGASMARTIHAVLFRTVAGSIDKSAALRPESQRYAARGRIR